MIEKTFLEFRAAADFDRGSNDNPAGREIATLLAKELFSNGISAEAPIQEDWGWCFFANADGVRVLVGCGAYAEYEDGWLTFVEPTKLSWGYWFNRGAVLRACGKTAAIVRDIIAADRRFYDLQWWTDPVGVGPTIPAV